MSGKSGLLVVVFFLSQLAPATASAKRCSIGGQIGYNNGPGMVINGTLSDFAEGIPLRPRLGLGYSAVGAGNAAEAR